MGAQDIADVVFELGLPCLVEPHKRYPRDHAAYGRVRVRAWVMHGIIVGLVRVDWEWQCLAWACSDRSID